MEIRNIKLCRPQMVDIGSEQGLSNIETAGIAGYVEDFKRAKTPLWAKRCRLWMGTKLLKWNHLSCLTDQID